MNGQSSPSPCGGDQTAPSSSGPPPPPCFAWSPSPVCTGEDFRLPGLRLRRLLTHGSRRLMDLFATTDRRDPLAVLHDVFGHTAFRGQQEAVVRHVTGG